MSEREDLQEVLDKLGWSYKVPEQREGYAQTELDLKPEDFSEEVALIVLKQICDTNREDLEVIHFEADKLLCALLEEKYPNLVKKFIELPKWYA